MPGVDFQVLRQEITMEQVLSQLGFQPKNKSGSQWRGVCPIHETTSERGPTFSVNVDTARYQCHKCQSKGNQIELWAAVKRLSIYDAAVDLCKALGRDVPWIERW